MERRITDREGIEWTLVQAYAGVARTAGAEAAGEATGHAVSDAGTVPVVCTPSRSEATVRLELPEGWHDRASDDDLLRALTEARPTR